MNVMVHYVSGLQKYLRSILLNKEDILRGVTRSGAHPYNIFPFRTMRLSTYCDILDKLVVIPNAVDDPCYNL